MKFPHQKLIFPLLLSSVAIVTSLILIEISLSRLQPQKTFSQLYEDADKCWRLDTEVGLALKPNCELRMKSQDFDLKTRTNSKGFRGQDDDFSKPEGEFRIVVTGDSFIFGQGLKDNETLTEKLKDLLRTDTNFNNRQINITNAGFYGGFSPDGHLVGLRKLLKSQQQQETDLVVMSMYVFNDIAPDMESNEWIGIDNYSTPKKIRSKNLFVNNDGVLLDKNSKSIYNMPFLKNLHMAVFLSEQVPIFRDKIINKSFNRKAYIPESLEPTDSFMYGVQIQDCIFGEAVCHRRIENLFYDLVKVFKAAKLEVEGSSPKAKFLVLIIPADFQIYSDAAKKYSQETPPWSIQGAYLNPSPQPQKRIKQMLDREKIEYVDLLPLLRERSQERTFFLNDSHWNPLGASIAAGAVHKWIEKNYKF